MSEAPKSEINDVQPSSLRHIVGQDGVKNVVSVAIDACPMEGFDAAVLDETLGLAAQGFAAQVIVALGYRSAGDFNAAAPKSRLPEAALFTDI